MLTSTASILWALRSRASARRWRNAARHVAAAQGEILLRIVRANAETVEAATTALSFGAEGIGLYRSEFLVTGGVEDIRDEDRQYEIYRGMLEGMAPGIVTVRTFLGSPRFRLAVC